MPQTSYRGVSAARPPVAAAKVPAARESATTLLRDSDRAARIAQKSRAGVKARKAKVTAKDLAIFTRQLSVMINAGLPLVQSLELLAANQQSQGFASVLTGVRSSVEGGTNLSAAFQNYPRVFDQLYSNMIAAGESGGILDGVLERLSSYIEKAVKLKRAVKSALIYPLSVLGIAVGVMFLLLWKVVPIFATLFVGLGVVLPLPTRLVIGLSHMIASSAWIVIAVLVGTI